MSAPPACIVLVSTQQKEDRHTAAVTYEISIDLGKNIIIGNYDLHRNRRKIVTQLQQYLEGVSSSLYNNKGNYNLHRKSLLI
jgi:hypothetical protein